MLKKVLTLSLGLLLSTAYAETGTQKQRRRFNIFADLTYNSHNIQTKGTESTLDASTASTFSAIEVGGDYFFHPRWAATAKILWPISTDVDAQIKGFDFGARYFPFRKGYQTESELLGSKIETTPGWAPFLYGGFASREYQFSSTSLAFQGIEAGGGVDYHFEQNFFIRGFLNYEMLQNTTSRTLTGFAAGFGLGYSY